MSTSQAFAEWMDARHCANQGADDEGAAVVVDDGEFYRVISGGSIEECENEASGREILGSIVEGQRL